MHCRQTRAVESVRIWRRTQFKYNGLFISQIEFNKLRWFYLYEKCILFHRQFFYFVYTVHIHGRTIHDVLCVPIYNDKIVIMIVKILRSHPTICVRFYLFFFAQDNETSKIRRVHIIRKWDTVNTGHISSHRHSEECFLHDLIDPICGIKMNATVHS